MEEAIRDQGTFQRLKVKIQDMDLEERWFSYRDNAYKQISINWCEENEIPYME